MKKIMKNEAASYCCEASSTLDIQNMVAEQGIRKISKNEAASYCCEASSTLDVQALLGATQSAN